MAAFAIKLHALLMSHFNWTHSGRNPIRPLTSAMAPSAWKLLRSRQHPAAVFSAGVYDETAGDVPRIASAAAWNEVDIYNGSHWLNAETSPTVENYHQILDMYDGVLRTSYVWMQDNRRIGVHAEEFVSRDRADSAAVRVIITPEFSGNIRVRLPLRNWPPPPRRYALARLADIDAAAHKNPWLIWYPGYLQASDVKAQSSSGSALLSLSRARSWDELEIGEAVAARMERPRRCLDA